MADYLHEKNASDFDAIQLSIAGPEEVLSWSHGEVLKPETINYRTQKPEKDGLFDERIFGPSKDFECYCGKYKGAHYRGVTCDRCGVLVARAIVRRERMGHIALAVPVTHVWFLRRTPSSIGLILNMTGKNLEKIAYFANYVVTHVDEDKKEEQLREMEAAYENNKAAIKQKFEEMAQQDETGETDLAAQQKQELEQLDDEYTTQRSRVEALVEKALLTENEYRELREDYRDIFTARTGAEAIRSLLEKIDLDQTVQELREIANESQGQKQRKILKRLKKLEGMQKAGIKPTWMVLEYVPVIPPELRPMVQLTGGRFATSDLNDLYRRVINRNNRLKKLLDLNAPEVICRNEMRMLQEAVDALIDNSHVRGGRSVNAGRRKLKSLSDQLRGKQGRFRQNLLGKRVDYSGRSVIVSGPELQIDQCGIPKMMALSLFKPFLIGKLIEHEAAHNVKAASQMIENNEPIVWDMLDEVIEHKYVLLNRAPTLHRLGVQAFRPVLIEGKAIQLHPLVCEGFNADFDGDQMAVHVPLSDEAQAEARDIMSADKNLLYPSNGNVMVYISQDMVLGAYYMTYDRENMDEPHHEYASVTEALHAYESGLVTLHTPIRTACDDGETRITTIGRILFNQVLPADHSFRNHTFAKPDLEDLATEVFNSYGMDILGDIADQIKTVGFQKATESGLSTGMDDYIIPEAKKEILKRGEDRVSEISDQHEQGLTTEDERYRLTVDAWLKTDEQLKEAVKEDFYQQDNSTTIVTVSGARAKLGAVNQIIGMIGLRQDVYGNTIELPVKSNYKEGLDVLEYFTDARGSRKGLIDTALKTADSGYLTRRLVDVSQDVFTIEDDCGDDEGVMTGREEAHELDVGFANRLVGRVAAEDVDGIVAHGELISRKAADAIEASDRDGVRVRSLLKCRSIRGVCRLCYGQDLSTGDLVDIRVPIGVMAAQAIGEPGTQLTLRTFHSGGAAGDDITQGLPRVNELFEAQNPKGQAQIADIEGTVAIKDHDTYFTVRLTPTGKPEHTYPLEGLTPTITDGDSVKPGDVIASSEDDKEIISATMQGTAKVTKNQIKLTAENVGPREYTVPKHRSLLVADGETVTPGQRLTTGSVNVQDLLHLTDTAEVQRYIINEVQRVFSLQGATIADKHLEVIVRQMTSRVHIEDPGESRFVTGDIVSKATIINENQQLRTNGQRPIVYKQLLLGISKTSLTTDSWLSAASFQDTTRILINAATEGSVDHLYGLKENVIIGRKIPVGTGYQPEGAEQEDGAAPTEVDE